MSPDFTNDENTGEDGPDPDATAVDALRRDHFFKVALAGALGLIAAATVFYHLEEGWSWVDSFYFSTIAVTTVGFGDLSPTTDISKLVTVAYVVAGISLIGAVLNESLKRRTERRVADR